MDDVALASGIARRTLFRYYSTKSAIPWGDFDAQEIFKNLHGELHIQPVNGGFAAYYDSMSRVDLTENHPDEKPFNISGTKVREILVSGERPDGRIIRPETADILITVYRERAAT